MTGLTYHIPVRLKHAKTQRYLTGSRQRYTHPGTSSQCSVAATTDASTDATLWLPKCANAPDDEGRPKGAVPVNTAFRLEHIATSKNLHSHKDRPSPTSRQQEITLYGEMGLGDDNDDWLVELSDLNPDHVRIRHRTTGAFLHSHDQAFPAHLGADLQEVTGVPDVSDPNNDWIVEPASSEVREPAFAEIRFTVGSTAIEKSLVGHTGFTVWKESVEKLILAERHKWEWVETLLSKTQHSSPNWEGIDQTAKRCTQSIQDLLSRLTECEKRFETEAFQQAVKSLNELLARTFSERTIFRHSRDPEVAPVRQMASKHPIEAAFCLGTLLKVSPRIQTPEAVHGAYFALTAAEGTSANRGEADRAAVDKAISQIKAAAVRHTEDLNRSRAEADRLVAKLTEDTQKFALDCNKAMNDAKAKFESLTEAMEAKVALKASIQYLVDRKKECSTAAWLSFGLFVVTAIISLLLLATTIRMQFAAPPSPTSGDGKSATSETNSPTSVEQNLRTFIFGAPNTGTPQAAPYLLILSLAALEFWVLKVFAKRWIGNLHASADADERITMLQTYLALISDGTLNSKDDLRLVLSAIFRPGNTGLLEEQGSFQTPIEFVLKRTTQGNSAGGAGQS